MIVTNSQERKDTPIFSGVIRYFPDALAAVARLSKIGNDKHNPGEPLHWAREKSTDHGDCIIRHQIEFDQIDPDSQEYHAVSVAWRALAQLQLLEETKRWSRMWEEADDGHEQGGTEGQAAGTLQEPYRERPENSEISTTSDSVQET